MVNMFDLYVLNLTRNMNNTLAGNVDNGELAN